MATRCNRPGCDQHPEYVIPTPRDQHDIYLCGLHGSDSYQLGYLASAVKGVSDYARSDVDAGMARAQWVVAKQAAKEALTKAPIESDIESQKVESQFR